jgi:hypothetical protein
MCIGVAAACVVRRRRQKRDNSGGLSDTFAAYVSVLSTCRTPWNDASR